MTTLPAVDVKTTTTNGLSVICEGKSGAIKVTLPENGGSFRIYLDKVEEIDGVTSAIVKSVKKFKETNMTWVKTSELFQELAVDKLQFTVPFNKEGEPQAGSMKFIVYIFKADGSIVWAEETFDVLKDQVKFTFEIEQWPFVKTTNKLRVGVSMNAVGGKHTTKRKMIKKDKANKGKKPKTVDDDDDPRKDDDVVLLGPAALLAPTVCTINNVTNTSVMDIAPVVSSEYDGAENGIQWTFPYFSSRLVFDPTIDTVSDLAITDNDTSTPDNGLSMLGIVAGILLIGVVVYGIATKASIQKDKSPSPASNSQNNVKVNKSSRKLNI